MTKTLLIVIGIACALIITASNSIKTEPPAQTQTFEEWLKKTEHVGQYRDLTILKNIPKEKIVVVRNDLCDENIKKAKEKVSTLSEAQLSDHNHDRVQDALDKLSIPYTLIGKSELEKDDYSLNDKWVILFNCNDFMEHCCNRTHKEDRNPRLHVAECSGEGPHLFHKTELSVNALKKIKGFVEAGGYLFTEHLSIVEILARVFKKTIVQRTFLPDKNVIILPAPDTEKHPYLKNVFEFPVPPPEGNIGMKWMIDDASPDIKVIDKKIVKVLIMSPQLVNKWNIEGAMAVTFSVSDKATGKPGGQVLHTIAHFDRQSSKTGEFALQNLLVNFLEDCVQRHNK